MILLRCCAVTLNAFEQLLIIFQEDSSKNCGISWNFTFHWTNRVFSYVYWSQLRRVSLCHLYKCDEIAFSKSIKSIGFRTLWRRKKSQIVCTQFIVRIALEKELFLIGNNWMGYSFARGFMCAFLCVHVTLLNALYSF